MLGYYKDLLKDFKDIPGIVIVYGSVSKEQSRIDSDIDIAVFSYDKQSKIMADEIADEILFKTGKVVSIFWFNIHDFKSRINEPFFQDVLKGEILSGGKLLKRISS
jgi:predicted nucleotidyltransferase